MNDEEFLTFMKQSLPQYVVQCFLYAGYDTARVVAQMDTDSGPTNSIDEIESFILKNFPTEKSCYHMSLSSKSYVFTPGHRTRILNFIEDVKKSLFLGKRTKQQPEFICNRKMKSAHCGINKTSSYECSEPSYDLKAITEGVRDRIIKWMRKQTTKDLQELKEHKHYKVNVCLHESECPTVDVLCLVCDTKLRLGQKMDEHSKCIHLISNWTSHIIKCLAKKKSKQENKKQVAISGFFGTKSKDAGFQSTVAEKSTDSCKKEDFQQAPSVQVNQEGQL